MYIYIYKILHNDCFRAVFESFFSRKHGEIGLGSHKRFQNDVNLGQQ